MSTIYICHAYAMPICNGLARKLFKFSWQHDRRLLGPRLSIQACIARIAEARMKSYQKYRLQQLPNFEKISIKFKNKLGNTGFSKNFLASSDSELQRITTKINGPEAVGWHREHRPNEGQSTAGQGQVHLTSPPESGLNTPPALVWITCNTAGMDRQRIKTTDCATIVQRKPFTPHLLGGFKLAAQLSAAGSTITPSTILVGTFPCIGSPASEGLGAVLSFSHHRWLSQNRARQAHCFSPSPSLPWSPLLAFIVAALGIRTFPQTHLDYTRATAVQARDYTFNGFYQNQSQLPSLSYLRPSESRSIQEGGKDRPCSAPRNLSLGGVQELMSKRPHASDFLSGSPSRRVRKTVATTELSPRSRNDGTVEPLEPQQTRDSGPAPLTGRTGSPDPTWRTATTRSIGMHAILNPSHTLATGPSAHQMNRDIPEPTPSTSPSPSTNPHATPTSAGLTPQSDRSVSQHDRTMYSPLPQRHILTARSPGVHAPSIGPSYGPARGTMTVEHNPFLPPQQPYGDTAMRPTMEAPPSMRYSLSHPSVPSATLPIDPRPITGRQGSGPQITAPGTTHSAYSPLIQGSHVPASTNLLQQPVPSLSQPTGASFIGDDNRSRTPQDGGSSYTFVGGQSKFASPRDIQSRLSVPVDFDSGSRKAAEKRLKNSDASKRFRERKKVNEKEMKQEVERQKDDIKFLTEERNFYRAERDFFRTLYDREVGLHRIPPRPTSPRLRQSSAPVSESETEQQFHDRREGLGSEGHVRQRTSSAPTRLPLPPMSPAQPNPYPTSWSTSTSATPVSQPARSGPPYNYPTSCVPPETSLPPIQSPGEPQDRSWNSGT
ncbi:uncharacterized protein BDCG_08972 [Blastomyces dermatitidis ER-3]|uniref:BZIP domain-containing protein n=1 Tax=Ajellomyces dermatitidis (strain ER-3 / ATCC MYA-2586) TaxID=559297 RepID=A0ABP2EV21_AJEDR|nr:uncharacterized protein BDCG_08972 [Blastomyces dermatitidis ER-3]EEQ85703.1 hypothetical protein BDCG_08972 [Blastomyces dermatitidis ER-3]